jgi:polyhydroxyalkanoate synthesis regulator phasin
VTDDQERTKWATFEHGEILFGLLADRSDEGELTIDEAREIAADLLSAADEAEADGVAAACDAELERESRLLASEDEP